jgi:hypothetical protein
MIISLTEMSGLIAKEKSLGNFPDRIAVDQRSPKKATVEPSPMVHLAIPL